MPADKPGSLSPAEVADVIVVPSQQRRTSPRDRPSCRRTRRRSRRSSTSSRSKQIIEEPGVRRLVEVGMKARVLLAALLCVPDPGGGSTAGAHQPRVGARRLHDAQEHGEAAGRAEGADRRARRADRRSDTTWAERRTAAAVRERHRAAERAAHGPTRANTRVACAPHRSRRRRFADAVHRAARADLRAVDRVATRP